MLHSALLALEDGSLFEGLAFGHSSSTVYTVGEVVFNTAMTGYQEILTDPSYAGQLINLTYPQVGNVGVNPDDNESNTIYANGLIIRQLPLRLSSWRAQGSLDDFLRKHQTLGIAEIDTRRLTRLIREKGALRGCIYHAPEITPALIEEAIGLARSCSTLNNLDLAKEVTTLKPYLWKEGGLWSGEKSAPEKRSPEKTFKLVAYDFGIKKTILRCLADLGCEVSVVPAKTPAETVLAMSPDGVFLSNGPGDPAACDYAIEAIQLFLEAKIPLFGICLGHQLLALACGGKTVKMKFGHHGGNHPVRSLEDQRVLITSQNHGFTVEDHSLPECLEVTHRSLFDQTIQGFRHRTLPVFAFQGHPEAGPGPNDGRALFRPFIEAMRSYQPLALKSVLSPTALEPTE